MIANIERHSDGIANEIRRSLEQDSPIAAFYIAFHEGSHNDVVFTANLDLRGLAAFLRELADSYEKAADENGGEMPPDRTVQ